MRITNSSKKRVIAKNAVVCISFLSQSLGLMFRRKIVPLLFVLGSSRRETIHSFFMLKTIDVLFLDENKKVVDMTTLKPWSWFTPKVKVKYVVEVRSGVLQVKKTVVGDVLRWD